MKTCKMGCGKMKSGGAATKPIKKMKPGGVVTLKDIINKNFPMSGTTGPIMMKKGGSSSLPICKGGKVRMPDGSCNKRETTFKKGGAIKKFAALAPPYDKATAADRIAGAKKNSRKKK